MSQPAWWDRVDPQDLVAPDEKVQRKKKKRRENPGARSEFLKSVTEVASIAGIVIVYSFRRNRLALPADRDRLSLWAWLC
jgi:hypothetical protein